MFNYRLRYAVGKQLGRVAERKRAERVVKAAKRFYATKRKTLFLNAWKLFLLREYQNKAKILKLRAFTQRKLLEKSFASWTMFHKTALIKQQMSILARNFQVRHSCKPWWIQWKEETVKAFEEREKETKADNNYAESLLVKAFVVLRNHAKNTKVKRTNMQRAEYLANVFLMRRCIALMRQYAAVHAKERARNEAFGKIMSKVMIKIQKKEFVNCLIKWANYVEGQKKLQVIVKTATKYLMRFYLTNMKEYVKEGIDNEQNNRKADSCYRRKLSKKIMKKWAKESHQRKVLKAKYEKHTAGKEKRDLQKIVSKWRETTLIYKSLNESMKKVRVLENARLTVSYWEAWKANYIASVEERDKLAESDQHYAETMLVKAFAVLKSHYKHHYLRHEKVKKANSFYELLLTKKALAALQEYGVNQKARKMHRFELSRRISQIDQFNLKETAFKAFYSWYVYKKRLVAGYNVLCLKQAAHIKKRYLVKWCLETKTKMMQKIEQESAEHEKAVAYFNIQLISKTFTALKSVAVEGVRKMKRERLHNVFTAWKMKSKEKAMLKKYLKQCNLDEKYAMTPNITYRFEAPRLHETVRASAISPESSMGVSTNRLGSDAVISSMKSENVIKGYDHKTEG